MIDERPEGCCGKCPPIASGGYDCTCRENPRCPNFDARDAVWDIIEEFTERGLIRDLNVLKYNQLAQELESRLVGLLTPVYEFGTHVIFSEIGDTPEKERYLKWGDDLEQAEFSAKHFSEFTHEVRLAEVVKRAKAGPWIPA